MMAGKQYNSYATGDMTIGNGGTDNKWVGALDGQVTISGMTGGGTAYPEQGATRLYNYYATDVVLKEEVYTDNGSTLSETKTIETTDRGSGKVSYDKVMVSTPMTKAEMASADFAATLNANIKEINGILAAYGITGIALREWAALRRPRTADRRCLGQRRRRRKHFCLRRRHRGKPVCHQNGRATPRVCRLYER